MLISLAGHELSGFRVQKPHSKRESETFYEVECIACGVSQLQPGSRLTLGSALCKSSFHNQSLTNKALREMEKELLAEAEQERRQGIDRAEQQRAVKIAQRRADLEAEYRALCRWLLKNVDVAAQESFFSQISLRHWIDTNDQDRELILQIFKKKRGEDER